jgi:uncharacterized protein YdaU (DUF1376 family)
MSLPYFPMYPADFEAKTSHLTIAEDGAYNRLLRICWMTPGCTMPNDEAWIMRRVRAHTDEDKATVRSVLAEFFTVENGRYSNAKLMKVWLASNEAHEKRKNAGAKGGKSKAVKNNNNGSSNAVAMPKQPEPEPEPDIKKEDTNVSLQVSPAGDVAEAVRIYNDAAAQVGWPSVQKLTPTRSRSLKARMVDAGGVDGWRFAVERATRSDFLCGRTPKPWAGFGFDWLTKAANFTKLMEGNYDNRFNGPFGAPEPSRKGGDRIFDEIARAAGLGEAQGGGGF